jgi:hypothetical protein
MNGSPSLSIDRPVFVTNTLRYGNNIKTIGSGIIGTSL